MLPILYSFRRCPFAIRARITLAYAGIEVELREILLRDKPPAMLHASPKGTVPVLVLPDGRVIDESVDVMRWALDLNDPDHWWSNEDGEQAVELVKRCDFEFKPWLDRYKYADRYPEHPGSFYRQQAECFLAELEQRLENAGHLLHDRISYPDVAIFPFIRQFAMVDKPWFDQAPYPRLQTWLESFLSSVLFLNVMTKYPPWQEASKHE